MYSNIKLLPTITTVDVKDMMNTNFIPIHSDDSLRRAIITFEKARMDTLPVLDSAGQLIGVFPRWRLYKALLDGKTMDDPCSDYIVHSPKVNFIDQTYQVPDLLNKATGSPVGTVPVLDKSNKVVAMLSGLDYFRQTIKVVTESLAFLDSIFHGMYEGMVVMNNDGHVLMINQAFESLFGLDLEDVKDKHINDIFSTDVFSSLDFTNQSFVNFQCNIKSVSVIINAVPIIKNNEQIGINMVMQDVSNLESIAQELEITKELQATLTGVLNASSDGVFVTTTSGIIKYVNDKAAELMGVEEQNMIKQHLIDFIPCKPPTMVSQSGTAEVDVCHIKGKPYIISHVPIIEDMSSGKSVGVVNTVYSSENKLTEDIARKWFSLRQQVQYYRDELEKRGIEKGSFDEIVSANASFAALKDEAQRIARSSSTILLTGESGVGKDMFARAIHSASPRAKHPFVKVNCAAIPETLLESELFGYASGSFTGALKKGKPGYFEQANQGTIFLDEIGDMPLSIQVKILQVLQDKQFIRVGGTNTEKVDVRIIAATNRDLREAISNGTFREDLYYRLNVIEFNLPPLRARAEDIIPLAQSFVHKYNQILGSNIVEITNEAQEALLFYNWPGNIRELENAIERAANYAWEGEIGLDHLPPHIFGPDQDRPQASSYRAALNEVDKEIIVNALKATNGNKSAAARLLRISRSSFYEKLTRYGLI